MFGRREFLTGGLGLSLWSPGRAGAADPYEDARSAMLVAIEADFRATASSTKLGELDPAIRDAIARVPRHRFVPARWTAHAYSNRALPIGHGQTISQPFVVALMTQLIDPRPQDRVLEIGTGSGYQAAVLAGLVACVHTIEIVRPLGERSARLLRELGHSNVEVRIGDGYGGWPEAAPFDAILMTAAPDAVPQPLIDQLAPGGRLVAPVGPQDGTQQLLRMDKEPDGRTVTQELLPVRFVPLTRERRGRPADAPAISR